MDNDRELLIANEDLKVISLDRAVELTGGFARYQIVLQLFGFYLCFTNAYQALLFYFAADDPPWRCTQNATSNFCVKYKSVAISPSSPHFFKRCDLNRSEWTYTTDEAYSIVTEFNLVCSRESVKSLLEGTFFIGWGIAGVLTGRLSDYYGRKKTALASHVVLIVSSTTLAFAKQIWQLFALRTLSGACYGTIIACYFVLVTEFTPTKYRTISSLLFHIAGPLSNMLFAGIAYYLPNWRKLIIYTCAPSILSVVFGVLLDKSPRWLVTAGEYDKAKCVFEKLGKFNKHPFDSKYVFSENDTGCKVRHSYLDLCRNKTVFFIMACLCMLWFSCGLLFYGLSYAGSSLGLEMHLSQVLLMAIDFPATLFVIYFASKFGRKKASIGHFLGGTLFLIAIACIPSDYKHINVLKPTFAIIGKGCVTAAFNLAYLWSFEIYPTVVRTQGLAVCQIAGRVGSAIAPFIANNLEVVLMQLPFVVFAAVGVLAVVCTFFLPETNRRPTREKFQDFFATVESDDLNVQSS